MTWSDIDVECDCGKTTVVNYSEYDLHDDSDCDHDFCYTEYDIERAEQKNQHLVKAVQAAHEYLGHTTLLFDNCMEVPCRDIG